MMDDWGRTVSVYGLLVLVGLLGAVADAVLNQWAKSGRVGWLLAAYLSWVVVATALGYLLKLGHFSFSGAVVAFLLSNTVFAVLLDYLVFSGRLGAWQWAGLACAVVALCLLEMGRGHAPEAPETTARVLTRDP
jgi:drug/metabolite transporter (DMT)-like permease